jgi:hypothetical protein
MLPGRGIGGIRGHLLMNWLLGYTVDLSLVENSLE